MEEETGVEVVAVAALQGGDSAAQARVAVPGVGAEEPVVGQERWEQIHRLRAAGMTVSAISRSTGLDRKTVRRCVRQGSWQGYRRPGRREALLDAHRTWLEERAAQVGYSARILYQELRAQHGFAGCYETVRGAVRPLRQEAAAGSLTQCRFETGPGEQAQADGARYGCAWATKWLRAHLRDGAGVLASRLGRGLHAHERMESLLGAQEHALQHFGGVTREILYDRMRTVIQASMRAGSAGILDGAGFAQHGGSSRGVRRL